MTTREESARVMEQVFADAFDKAKGWKKDHGVRGIGTMKPPVSYKMTLWLRPWHYMQVCNDAARAGVSVTKFLQEQLTDPRLKAFLPTRENKKLWDEIEGIEKPKKKVSSLAAARVKRKLLAAKGVTVGELLPPGARKVAFARARRAVGLRG